MKDIKGQDLEIGDLVVIPKLSHCRDTLYELTELPPRERVTYGNIWVKPLWGFDRYSGHITPEGVLKIPKEWKDDKEKVTLHVKLAGYWQDE